MVDETQPSPDQTASVAPQEPATAVPDPSAVTPDPTPAPAPEAGATPTTSTEPAAPTTGSQPDAKPVVVNQYTRRSGDDALLGQFVDVVGGEFQGRRGAYVDDDTHDPKTGYPAQVFVRTRDAENELIVVNYSDIRPSAYTGGR